MNKMSMLLILSSIVAFSAVHAFEPSSGAYGDPSMKREYNSGFSPVAIDASKEREITCSWAGKKYKEGDTLKDGDNEFQCMKSYKRSRYAKEAKPSSGVFVVAN